MKKKQFFAIFSKTARRIFKKFSVLLAVICLVILPSLKSGIFFRLFFILPTCGLHTVRTYKLLLSYPNIYLSVKQHTFHLLVEGTVSRYPSPLSATIRALCHLLLFARVSRFSTYCRWSSLVVQQRHNVVGSNVDSRVFISI